MELSSESIKQFQEKILDWYSKNKRVLPWRESSGGTSLNERAYRVFISEVMSQQTQISRVIPKYEAWLQAFPTIQDLANASVADILRLWSGLGYNRRALFLQKTAQKIIQEYNGVWPRTVAELKKLPGIGEYTACAIACFAFDQQLAVVDTNVRRVILTQFQISNFKSQISNEKEIQAIADQILPKGRAYDWNQALMDYASAMLKKEKISIPKQSKFIGSRRYYRGKILKLLVKNSSMSLSTIGLQLKDDYSDADKPWVESIITELEKEGFVKKHRTNIRFVK